MKKTLLILALMLSMASTCFARAIIHDAKPKTDPMVYSVIEKVEKYYQKELPDCYVYIEYTDNDFLKRLIKMGFNLQKAIYYTKTAQAICQIKNGNIAINMDPNAPNKDFFDFIVAHEFVHVYQVRTYSPEVIKNKGLMEGQADLKAAAITNCTAPAIDHKIPLSKLNNFSNWTKVGNKKALQQCRYYAKCLMDKGEDLDSPLVKTFG